MRVQGMQCVAPPPARRVAAGRWSSRGVAVATTALALVAALVALVYGGDRSPGMTVLDIARAKPQSQSVMD